MGRVFVTGASGFVGGALLGALLRRGDEVVALARSDAAAAALRARGAEVVRGDVLDEDAVAAGMAGCELAFHVAGINTMCPGDPMALLHVNVRGAEAVVRAAARAGLRRVVHTSSAAALGEPAGTVGREDSPHRGWYLSAYERSKHEGELAAFAAARRAGVELVAVNPSSVQGPGRASGTGRILIAHLDGRLPVFVDTRLSLVDVADCTLGHLLAAERGRAGERYVLNGVTLTSLEALDLVAEIAGVRRRPRMLPAPVAAGAAAAIEAAFRLRGRTPPVCREMGRTLLHGHRYDGTRAERELGLRYTPVRETLARTVAWAAEAGLLARAPGRPDAEPGVGGPGRGYLQGRSESDGGVRMAGPDRPPDEPRGGEERLREDPARARPGWPQGDFAEGIEHAPADEEQPGGPDFARGARTRPEPQRRHRGDFAEGIEQAPAEDEQPGRPDFARGIDERPTDE